MAADKSEKLQIRCALSTLVRFGKVRADMHKDHEETLIELMDIYSKYMEEKSRIDKLYSGRVK